ncbi:hypothetical protein Cgig2_018515 [Carnegiea gigantea]|uniref:BHLH domain-containing protein n=1 Tax=Carnegiea gigantea TaxID=171969 RepID=A0A9Q1KNS0_9CARY|nr:hypothetical protein Cgig2_018515 [Carnegiea gigantea]
MADLFDPSSSSSPPQPPPPHTALNFVLESDDISSLLHTLLQNSSQPSTSCAPAHHQQPPPPAPEDRCLFARSAGYQAGMLDSPSGLNFRFSGGFYSSGANELAGNAFSSSIGLSMEGIGEVECESEDQLEVPANPPPVRISSKRSRAAEVHNLSEKRRRQRINEKMKALQKLIPNSNKTDKASMLDEAIEYLKQLQLEVQREDLFVNVRIHIHVDALLHVPRHYVAIKCGVCDLRVISLAFGPPHNFHVFLIHPTSDKMLTEQYPTYLVDFEYVGLDVFSWRRDDAKFYYYYYYYYYYYCFYYYYYYYYYYFF